MPEQYTGSLPPVQRVVEDLSELTGRSPREVVRMLMQETKLIGTTVRQSAERFGLVPHRWNQQLMDFYASTDAFLFETATWNFTLMKNSMRQFVVQQLTRSLPPGSHVLCFGDGMGFDSDAISGAGFDVTCFEVSGLCLKFAERLFQRHQRTVKIETEFQKLKQQKFDAIVCLDVLEHVPDPPALVGQFSCWLREGGIFVVHAPYYHIDQTRPTHLESNRQYAGQVESLYGKAGFHLTAIGGFLLDPLVFIKDPAISPHSPWGKKLVGQQLTAFCRKVPAVPSWAAPLFTRLSDHWVKELKALDSRYEGIPKVSGA